MNAKKPSSDIPTLPVACGVYLRISLDKAGTALGVARQKTAILAKAQALGWPVVAIYEDNDKSASKANVKRPSYMRLLEDMGAGRIDAVLCLDIDRLIRRPIELEVFMDIADRKGVQLANVQGDIDLSTTAGKLMARIKGALAAQEVARLGERVAAEALQRAERGLPPKRGRWGRLFGYTPDWEIVPQEAKIVREIYSRVLDGEQSMWSVLAWLHENDVRTAAGQPFRRAGLNQLLDNPTYAGLRRLHGQVFDMGEVKAQWPAIIEPSTYYVWEARREASGGSVGKAHAPRRRRYVLGDIARCGRCLGPLTASRTGARRKNGERAVKLLCLKANGGCGRIARDYKAVLAFVEDCFFDEVERDFNSVNIPMAEEADRLEAEAKDCEAAVEKYRRSHEAGLLDLDDYLRFTKPHSARLVELRKSSAVTAKRLARPGASGVRAAYAGASVNLKRSMLLDRIEAVVVLPQVRGGTVFEPDLIQIAWRQRAPQGPSHEELHASDLLGRASRRLRHLTIDAVLAVLLLVLTVHGQASDRRDVDPSPGRRRPLACPRMVQSGSSRWASSHAELRALRRFTPPQGECRW